MTDRAELVARAAEIALADGPMGNTTRGDDYERLLDSTFGNGKSLRTVATSCAIFAGACLIKAGLRKGGKWPAALAITTWLGVRGFAKDDPETEDVIEGAWIPRESLTEVRRGDIFYVCSSQGRISLGGGKYYTWTRWENAANGHVGILLGGSDWLWKTAEGGGSPGGTICRMSAEPKDITRMSRPLRGVWRPSLMPVVSDPRDTDPAPPPVSEPNAAKRRTIRRGDEGADVADMQRGIGVKDDGKFGPITESAARKWQASYGIKADGIFGPQSWATLDRSRSI